LPRGAGKEGLLFLEKKKQKDVALGVPRRNGQTFFASFLQKRSPTFPALVSALTVFLDT